MTLAPVISRLVAGNHLSESEAEGAMRSVMRGETSPAELASLLTALQMKGETSREIAAFARVLREHAVRIRPKVSGMLVDTCGTGGDHSHTFNISTTAAFVAAGGGVPIVKHGNRSISSRCGSADVLEALGIRIDLPPRQMEAIVEAIRIGFLFAPDYHPAMRHAAPVRREIGIRTVFNLLGPLINPAGAEAQLLGVYRPDLVHRMAVVLRRLGVQRAMVVHGGGLDEITTEGGTTVSELDHGAIRDYSLHCGRYGLREAKVEDIRGGGAAENARILLEVLEGERGAARDIVLANAGAAIYVGGVERDLGCGIRSAQASIDSGAALAKLHHLIDRTREAA
ncbi:MAG: anthranilate phosphoribosyltransferase [Methanomicrobiales archaeon]|nr:anthranilate phosphoribosyltransferase [Methanomicrobiales archaeon]MDI6875670.1 anthranilate phosphoribosyltransferase [Methanomicrobiales archaeon]